MAAIQLTRTHRLLVGIVLAGAVLIAAIGFVGSYAAVRDLAERKGFGDFAPFFPIGIDAGIVVLLSLDLLLTWLRIPFPLLRQTAWLLTAATVAFNGAAAWGDPLAVGMHAIIPVLFIITVEAARHAIGRITDIAADRHMEGVRLWRWILAPLPTFRLWRRMKLWELRSYQDVIDLERDRLVYRARLRAQYGRRWRRKAPVEARLPLKLAHLGVPLDPRLTIAPAPATALEKSAPATAAIAPATPPPGGTEPNRPAQPEQPATDGGTDGTDGGIRTATRPEPQADPELEPDTDADRVPAGADTPAPQAVPPGAAPPEVTVPVAPGRRRRMTPLPDPPAPESRPAPMDDPVGIPSGTPPSQAFYEAYLSLISQEGDFPNARQLSRYLHDRHGVRNADGSLLSEQYLRVYLREFKDRYRTEAGTSV